MKERGEPVNRMSLRLLLIGDSSVQFTSVPQSFPTLCHPMDCSMPGLPVHHQLLEPTQTHVYHIGLTQWRGEGDDRGWDGWMASLTQWTWVSVNSGSWWWTGRPGVLWFMGSQRVRHDWVTDLIWSDHLNLTQVPFPQKIMDYLKMRSCIVRVPFR